MSPEELAVMDYTGKETVNASDPADSTCGNCGDSKGRHRYGDMRCIDVSGHLLNTVFNPSRDLIAAAPELLSALQNLLAQQSDTDKYEPLVSAQNAARAAIAKATL